MENLKMDSIERFNFVYNSLDNIGTIAYREVLEVLESLGYETKGKTLTEVANILISDNTAGKAVLPWITE